MIERDAGPGPRGGISQVVDVRKTGRRRDAMAFIQFASLAQQRCFQIPVGRGLVAAQGSIP
jgi:hypothetical protein